MPDARTYPERPYLAVSAAIVRDGKILVVRRARAPAHGLYSLPGGVVEVGETLKEALMREVRVPIQSERVRCTACRLCCSTDLTFTATMSGQRAASSNAKASAASVLLRRT